MILNMLESMEIVYVLYIIKQASVSETLTISTSPDSPVHMQACKIVY